MQLSFNIELMFNESLTVLANYLNHYTHWDLDFQLDQCCIKEILFWQKNLKSANFKSIDTMPSSSNYMAYCDASGSGCGAHLDLNGEQTCHKLWDQHEIAKSSTWRELSAIEFALKSFLPLVTNTYLKWFTDNQAACRIVQVVCMHKDLHDCDKNIPALYRQSYRTGNSMDSTH